MKRLFLSTPEAVGAAVQAERVSRGWSQASLADRAGVEPSFVADVEAGATRADLGKVLLILEALGIHATALPSVPNMTPREDVDLKAAVRRFG